MRCYYEDKEKILKTKGRVHDNIIIFYNNYCNHIKYKHPKINLEIIEEILDDPDYVYKKSRNTDTFYYEKKYNQNIFRVVVISYKKHVKEVITAYKVGNRNKFTVKHVYCVYDKENYISYEDEKNAFFEDIDYFYDLFNIERKEVEEEELWQVEI